MSFSRRNPNFSQKGDNSWDNLPYQEEKWNNANYFNPDMAREVEKGKTSWWQYPLNVLGYLFGGELESLIGNTVKAVREGDPSDIYKGLWDDLKSQFSSDPTKTFGADRFWNEDIGLNTKDWNSWGRFFFDLGTDLIAGGISAIPISIAAKGLASVTGLTKLSTKIGKGIETGAETLFKKGYVTAAKTIKIGQRISRGIGRFTIPGYGYSKVGQTKQAILQNNISNTHEMFNKGMNSYVKNVEQISSDIVNGAADKDTQDLISTLKKQIAESPETQEAFRPWSETLDRISSQNYDSIEQKMADKGTLEKLLGNLSSAAGINSFKKPKTLGTFTKGFMANAKVNDAGDRVIYLSRANFKNPEVRNLAKQIKKVTGYKDKILKIVYHPVLDADGKAILDSAGRPKFTQHYEFNLPKDVYKKFTNKGDFFEVGELSDTNAEKTKLFSESTSESTSELHQKAEQIVISRQRQMQTITATEDAVATNIQEKYPTLAKELLAEDIAAHEKPLDYVTSITKNDEANLLFKDNKYAGDFLKGLYKRNFAKINEGVAEAVKIRSKEYHDLVSQARNLQKDLPENQHIIGDIDRTKIGQTISDQELTKMNDHILNQKSALSLKEQQLYKISKNINQVTSKNTAKYNAAFINEKEVDDISADIVTNAPAVNKSQANQLQLFDLYDLQDTINDNLQPKLFKSVEPVLQKLQTMMKVLETNPRMILRELSNVNSEEYFNNLGKFKMKDYQEWVDKYGAKAMNDQSIPLSVDQQKTIQSISKRITQNIDSFQQLKKHYIDTLIPTIRTNINSHLAAYPNSLKIPLNEEGTAIVNYQNVEEIYNSVKQSYAQMRKIFPQVQKRWAERTIPELVKINKQTLTKSQKPLPAFTDLSPHYRDFVSKQQEIRDLNNQIINATTKYNLESSVNLPGIDSFVNVKNVANTTPELKELASKIQNVHNDIVNTIKHTLKQETLDTDLKSVKGNQIFNKILEHDPALRMAIKTSLNKKVFLKEYKSITSPMQKELANNPIIQKLGAQYYSNWTNIAGVAHSGGLNINDVLDSIWQPTNEKNMMGIELESGEEADKLKQIPYVQDMIANARAKGKTIPHGNLVGQASNRDWWERTTADISYQKALGHDVCLDEIVLGFENNVRNVVSHFHGLTKLISSAGIFLTAVKDGAIRHLTEREASIYAAAKTGTQKAAWTMFLPKGMTIWHPEDMRTTLDHIAFALHHVDANIDADSVKLLAGFEQEVLGNSLNKNTPIIINQQLQDQLIKMFSSTPHEVVGFLNNFVPKIIKIWKTLALLSPGYLIRLFTGNTLNAFSTLGRHMLDKYLPLYARTMKDVRFGYKFFGSSENIKAIASSPEYAGRFNTAETGKKLIDIEIDALRKVKNIAGNSLFSVKQENRLKRFLECMQNGMIPQSPYNANLNLEALIHHGVSRESQGIFHRLGTSGWSKTKNIVSKMMNYNDSISRMTAYYVAKEYPQAMVKMGWMPSEVLDNANLHDIHSTAFAKMLHFDYHYSTKVEEQFFNKAIPFYTWQRKNLGLQLTLWKKAPQRAVMWNKGRNDMFAALDLNPQATPDSVSDYGYLPLFKKNGQLYVFKFVMPGQDPFLLMSPHVFSRFNPLILSAINLVSGKLYGSNVSGAGVDMSLFPTSLRNPINYAWYGLKKAMGLDPTADKKTFIQGIGSFGAQNPLQANSVWSSYDIDQVMTYHLRNWLKQFNELTLKDYYNHPYNKNQIFDYWYNDLLYWHERHHVGIHINKKPYHNW